MNAKRWIVEGLVAGVTIIVALSIFGWYIGDTFRKLGDVLSGNSVR